MQDLQDILKTDVTQNSVIEPLTDEAKKKSRDFDEEEAYFLLVQIFSYAQATQDKVQFDKDLREWEKRFPIDLFSDELKRKIQIMLSEEYKEATIQGFTAWLNYSKEDYSVGLKKLRKVLSDAEHHKNESKLDKDLTKLFEKYPKEYLAEKYPHIVSQLLSNSYRTKILQKFDSELAYDELLKIIEHPTDFSTKDDFINAFDTWKELYPTADFDEKHKSLVEKSVQEYSDEKNLEILYTFSILAPELNGSIKQISKDALHDFINIVSTNTNDIDSLFDWTYKYSRYINEFEPKVKETIVLGLKSTYEHELPTKGTYKIPVMDSTGKFISKDDFSSIDETKKDSVIQLFGMLSNNQELTHEDIYQLAIINSNIQKVEMIEKSNIEQTVAFVEEKISDELVESFQDSLVVDVKTRVSSASTSSSDSTSGSTGGGFAAGAQREFSEELKLDKKEITTDKKEKEKDTVEDNPENIQSTLVTNTIKLSAKKDVTDISNKPFHPVESESKGFERDDE